MMTSLVGSPEGRDRKVGIVVARFNEEVTRPLLDGALRALKDAGVADGSILVTHVPGAVEIPFGAQRIVGKCDCVVTLGAVIRGDTDHYDYVCSMVANGVMRVMLDSGCPVAFGVLTCDTDEQAAARSGPGKDNKGYEAAMAALEMADLTKKVADIGAVRSLGFGAAP